MGRGSITNRDKRGRGWEARWYTTDADGKRHQHSRTFDKKKEAEEYLNEVLGYRAWGRSGEDGKASFGSVAASWLKQPRRQTEDPRPARDEATP